MAFHSVQDEMVKKVEQGVSDSIAAALSDKDDLTPAEIEALTPDAFELVPYSEENAERTGYSNYSYWRSTIRMFMKNKVAVAMLVIMCALLLFTFIQPYLPNQFDPYEPQYITQEMVDTDPAFADSIVGMVVKNQRPNKTYWFGTNAIGQDLWSNIWQVSPWVCCGAMSAGWTPSSPKFITCSTTSPAPSC